MSYAIVQPKTLFSANEVKVKGNYIGKNKIWKINEGEKVLHFAEGETGFLREIGLDSFNDRVKFMSFSDEEFKQIVQHFFQKGELRCIDYHDLDEDLEDGLRFLVNKLEVGKEQDIAAVTSFMEEYTDFVEEFAGKPWYLTLYREKQQVKLYPNGVMYATFKEEKTEALILRLYEDIFNLFGTSFTLSPVLITEKETTEHPLTHAHVYLMELLNLAGETAREQVNLSKEETEKINELLLKYTKDFENKFVYKP